MSQKNWVGLLTQLVVVLLLALLAFYVYHNHLKGRNWEDVENEFDDLINQADSLIQEEKDSIVEEVTVNKLRDYFPRVDNDQLVHHQFYSLSYSEKDEQAKWVAYELTRDRVNSFLAKRSNDFRVDPLVKTGSADLLDYKGSGFDRGHLCPAGDMKFSKSAMSESFYMSNMSPQNLSFNRGVWRELEEQSRDWARANKHLYVVTGPVLRKRMHNKIGDNRVSVPKAYFKVLLDLTEPEQKGIAFLIPNEKQEKSLHEFAITIDDLESLIEVDFFPALPDEQENLLESNLNVSRWIYNEERFKQRLASWNYN